MPLARIMATPAANLQTQVNQAFANAEQRVADAVAATVQNSIDATVNTRAETLDAEKLAAIYERIAQTARAAAQAVAGNAADDVAAQADLTLRLAELLARVQTEDAEQSAGQAADLAARQALRLELLGVVDALRTATGASLESLAGRLGRAEELHAGDQKATTTALSNLGSSLGTLSSSLAALDKRNPAAVRATTGSSGLVAVTWPVRFVAAPTVAVLVENPATTQGAWADVLAGSVTVTGCTVRAWRSVQLPALASALFGAQTGVPYAGATVHVVPRGTLA